MPKYDNMTPAYAAILKKRASDYEKLKPVSQRHKSGAPVTLPTVGGVDYSVEGAASSWTRYQEKLVERLAAENISVPMIARILGKNESNVGRKMKELGCSYPVGNSQEQCAAVRGPKRKYE